MPIQTFLYMLAIAVARSSSDDNTIHYVLLVLWICPFLKFKHIQTTVTLKLSSTKTAKSAIVNCLVNAMKYRVHLAGKVSLFNRSSFLELLQIWVSSLKETFWSF